MGSAFILTEYHSFPGYNALYPVLGTALIIYASTGFVNKFLSLQPMVFTGNISYSLYLWHWPILVFARYTSIDFTLINQIIFIALTYILSVLSWKYIEQPFRYFKLSSFKNITIKLYVIPSIFIFSLLLIGFYFDGYQNRFSPSILTMDSALHSSTSESREHCHSPYRNSEALPNKKCIFGENSEHKTQANVLIFGDSHANHMVPFIRALTEDAHVSGQDYTLDRCLPILDLKWGSTIHLAEKCKNRNKLTANYIQKNNFDFVVMAASWPGITTRRIFEEDRLEDNDRIEKLLKSKLIETLQIIVDSGAIPVMIADTPTLAGKSPKCPIKKELFNTKLNCDIFHHSNKLFNELIGSLSNEFPQLVTIRPQLLMCDAENCKMDLNGVPLYRDEDHLNKIGSKLLGYIFLESTRNPFDLGSITTKDHYSQQLL